MKKIIIFVCRTFPDKSSAPAHSPESPATIIRTLSIEDIKILTRNKIYGEKTKIEKFCDSSINRDDKFRLFTSAIGI